MLNTPWSLVDNNIQSLLSNGRVTFFSCLSYKIFSDNHINYEQCFINYEKRTITPKFDKIHGFNNKQHMFDTMRVELCVGIKSAIYFIVV